MRFLILQENGEHDANRHFRECFSTQRALNNLGYHCEIWGLNHPNFAAEGIVKIPDFNNYDVIIILENYDKGWLKRIAPQIRQSRAFKILWSIDAHCRGIEYYQNLYNELGCSCCLQATQDFVGLIPNSFWFPNCFDDTLIKPLSEVNKNVSIGFCGNYVNRKGWIDHIDQNIEGGIKKDIFVIGDEMVKKINSYHIHFNRNMSVDVNYRNFETIGCGTLLLTDHNHQYRELGFSHMENCVFYNTGVDLIIKIKELIKNPSEIVRIAKNGLDLSMNHSYSKRIESLLNFLKSKM